MLLFKKALCMLLLNLVYNAEGTSLNDGLYGNLNKLFCRCSSVVEHVIGNDGVVSPILISGTSFLLSPYFKGFFYALFSAHFNLHVGVTRHLRRQTRQNHLVYLDKPTILPERICKTFKTCSRMHLSFFPEF